jgi:hypothetical protein
MAPTSLKMNEQEFLGKISIISLSRPRYGWIRVEQTLDVFNRSIMLCRRRRCVCLSYQGFWLSSTTSIDYLGMYASSFTIHPTFS